MLSSLGPKNYVDYEERDSKFCYNLVRFNILCGIMKEILYRYEKAKIVLIW
jgi:hypothetical protein